MRRFAALGTVLLLATCQGSGSDIGPRLAPLPSASSKVNVFDDQNAGVVGARVSVVNSSTFALTGRNGRGDLFANPTGRQLLRVDGSTGAAAADDLLGVLAVAITLPGGDIPAVFHLPDARTGGELTLNVGTQTSTSSFANPAANGGTISISTGSSVGVGSGAATVTMRSGTLASHHLPGDLPAGTLMGRGLYVDPPEVTVTPGADVFVIDDLSAPGPVTLYHLENATGEWVAVGSGTPGAGVIQASAGITTGGLYAFGVPVVTGSVRGRIVDSLGAPVPEALVHVDGRRALSAGNGTFAVADVAAQAGDGSPRSATIEVFAGGSWMPAIASATVTMNGVAEVDAGDIGLDTLPAGNVRIQQVRRARAEPIRGCRLSSLFGSVAIATISDASGQAVFEDVPSQWFGFQSGFPKDPFFAYYAHAVGFSDLGRRWLDAYQFFDESSWFTGSRTSRILVTDAVGGGPLFDVPIVRGATDDVGFVSKTLEGGVVFAERSLDGRVTAALRTEHGGSSIVHALSIDTPNGEHLELPLQRALRPPLGAFDRHGLVVGTLTGVNPSAAHRLRVTRRLELEEWWDDVVEGIAIPSSLPIDVDPAVTHGAFRAGVDRSGGHLVATELSAAGSVTLQKLALAADVVPVEGATIARDLPLDHAAATVFAAPGVLAALDPAIAPTALTASLALGQPSGHAIDVVRDLGGNHAAVGNDLNLTLPALAGDLTGHSWYALVQGSGASAGGTVTQRVLLQFDAAGAVTSPVLLPPPTISQPAAAATVASSGFTVQFSLPAGTMYATLELRSASAGELLRWQVFVPPTATEFSFTRLPVEAQTPLISGKSYTLTLSSYASSTGGPFILSNDPYRDVTTYLQSIGAVERGVDAASAITIPLTTL